MALSAAQKTALKNDIAANTNTINGVQIKDMPNGPDSNFAIAAWYSGTASPDFYVWRDLSMEVVNGLITFANMTPVDTPDNTQTWANRSLACQGKQFNLQNLTIGRTIAPMKRTNYRAAMQDCLTNIPAGANGAAISANWTGVRDAAKGLANRVEKLFSTGTGSQATPADLPAVTPGAFSEGTISGNDVQTARDQG